MRGEDLLFLDDVVFHDGAPTCSRPLVDDGAPAATDPAPAGPEDEGDEPADYADDEEDVADGVDVEAGRRDVHGESQDGTDCNEDQADSDTHNNLLRVRLTDPVTDAESVFADTATAEDAGWLRQTGAPGSLLRQVDDRLMLVPGSPTRGPAGAYRPPGPLDGVKYRFELRRGDEVVATGHLSRERPLEVGEWIEIGGRQGVVRLVEPLLSELEVRLVVELQPRV
jgi:hypothetical protein